LLDEDQEMTFGGLPFFVTLRGDLPRSFTVYRWSIGGLESAKERIELE
jgi:hypothetical protein